MATTSLTELHEVLEEIQDGLVVLDRDWRFAYVNRRAAENVGTEPAALLGRNLWELYPTLLGTEAERTYRRVMTERVHASLEVEAFRP